MTRCSTRRSSAATTRCASIRCRSCIDLARPEKVFGWDDPQTPYMPWGWNTAVEGPVGEWLIEFMEKAAAPGLHYTLSAWWFTAGPATTRLAARPPRPRTHLEGRRAVGEHAARVEAALRLRGLVYVDLANEVPYFLPGFMERFRDGDGRGLERGGAPFTERSRSSSYGGELNPAMAALLRASSRSCASPPRSTATSAGWTCRWSSTAWTCTSTSDVDLRWRERTRFADYMPRLFTDASWHKEFTDRCAAARDPSRPCSAPPPRQLAVVRRLERQHGMPLTTSESWSSWYYFDSPDLDWGWLLEWAEWSVEDAIEYRMWGWTPHNYASRSSTTGRTRAGIGG